MGSLFLTNAALLGGLGILAIPILAHLMQPRARRPIVFPSIAFLQASAASQSRRNRIRRLIVLSLRMLAVAAIVLAFTRPLWLDAPLAAHSHPDAAAGVVVLLDASVSTQQTSGGSVVFDRLRSEAEGVLQQLRSGVDHANVVIVDDAPRALFPRLSKNLPALREQLAAIQPSESRARLTPALELAARLLEPHPGPRRLVILSDFQKSNWIDALNDEGGKIEFPSTEVVALPLSQHRTPGNVGLLAPEVFPAVPVAGQTADLSVTVQNFGDETRQATVSCELMTSEPSVAPTQEQTLPLPPGATRRLTFAVALPEEMIPRAKFTLATTDGLEPDNQSFLAIGSAPPIPVLVVSDDNPDDPGTAAYYLTRALAPFDGVRDARAPARFLVSHSRPMELTRDRLRGETAVFLGRLEVLTDEAATMLADYIESGGGVVLFAGSGPADANVTTLDRAAKGRLAPWRLTARQTFDRDDISPQITAGRWQSRWLREFDEQSQLALRDIGFSSIWNCGPAPSDAEIVLLFSDGQPALGGRVFGRGQFLLANFSPEPSTSDLGKHGSFVAFAQIIAAALQRSTARPRGSLVGEPVYFAASVPTARFRVIGPGGNELPAVRTDDSAGSRVSLARAEAAGIYRLEIDGTLADAAAVNIDPRESNLTPVDLANLEDRLRTIDHSGSTRILSEDDAVALTPGGRPLWGQCLVAGMLALAAEMLLLAVWRR